MGLLQAMTALSLVIMMATIGAKTFKHYHCSQSFWIKVPQELSRVLFLGQSKNLFFYCGFRESGLSESNKSETAIKTKYLKLYLHRLPPLSNPKGSVSLIALVVLMLLSGLILIQVEGQKNTLNSLHSKYQNMLCLKSFTVYHSAYLEEMKTYNRIIKRLRQLEILSTLVPKIKIIASKTRMICERVQTLVHILYIRKVLSISYCPQLIKAQFIRTPFTTSLGLLETRDIFRGLITRGLKWDYIHPDHIIFT